MVVMGSVVNRGMVWVRLPSLDMLHMLQMGPVLHVLRVLCMMVAVEGLGWRRAVGAGKDTYGGPHSDLWSGVGRHVMRVRVRYHRHELRGGAIENDRVRSLPILSLLFAHRFAPADDSVLDESGAACGWVGYREGGGEGLGQPTRVAGGTE